MSGCAVRGLPWSEPETPLLAGESAALPAPEGLRATSGELRSIPLKWEPLLVGQVGGYVLERSASRDGPFERLAVIPGRLQTRYVDRDTLPGTATMLESTAHIDVAAAPPAQDDALGSNRDDGTTWFYRTRAYQPDGALALSASPVVTGTTAPPPGPPDDLRAYSRQPRNVPLSWRTSEDPLVSGYRVERSPTARGPYQLLAQIDGRHQTTYVDRGLGDLRVFYYRVTAVNPAGGLGQPTPPVQAVTKPEPLPPVALKAVEKRLGRNVLAWEPNVEPDIVRYRVIRTREDGESEIVAAVAQDSTQVTDDAVGAGERVVYTVEAVDRDGLVSETADPIDVESESYGLSAHPKADGIHLEWNPRGDEGFHGANVSRIGVLRSTQLGFSSDGRFVDSDVEAGESYRYSVLLERDGETPAPRSQTLEVRVPDPAEAP